MNLDYNIVHIQETDSTMNEIRKYSAPVALYSDRQTAGRGKGDRKWDCSSNNNLYMSIKIKADNPSYNYFQLTFLIAVAISNALRRLTDGKIELHNKWPNDVLLSGKKLVGILLENDPLSKELVIGFGVNIDYCPETALFSATSLLAEGFKIDKNDLAKAIVLEFDIQLRHWKNFGFKPIKELWVSNVYNFKQEITVKNSKYPDLKGIFADFTDDGVLVLEMPDGQLVNIHSGDIF